MKKVAVLAVAGLVAFAACSGSKGSSRPPAANVPSFPLTSSDVTDGQPLGPAQRSGSGGNVSPQLRWYGFPPATKSFAATVYDRDAGYWHWAIVNIPNTTSALATGLPYLPPGAVELKNSSRKIGYAGAAPPKGTGVHHYEFTVYALDVTKVNGASASSLPKAMSGHILAKATIVGLAEAGA